MQANNKSDLLLSFYLLYNLYRFYPVCKVCKLCMYTEVRMFRMASIFDFTLVLSYKSQHIKELLSSGVMWFDRTDRRPQCVTRLHCYRPIACRAVGQRARPISSLLLQCVQCVLSSVCVAVFDCDELTCIKLLRLVESCRDTLLA